jgi:iron complex transport system substrate-binding protein
MGNARSSRLAERMRAQLAACCAMFLLVLVAPAQATRVVDDRGIAVDLPQPPQRIISLLPSLGETVCALGACDRLIGVDSYANWPDAVQRLPRLGGVDDANIERIVALQPDLVLLSASSRAIARLQGLGIPVLGLDLKTLQDVHRTLDKVAQALALPAAAADAAWARIDHGIEAAARALPASVRGTTVYFEVGSGYAASESSHIGQLLARLGALDIVPARLGSVPKLNPEFVVRADPQVIMLPAGDARPPSERPGWSRTRAVREGRVCAFDPAQSDVLMRPGPRLAEAAAILAQCLRRHSGEVRP